MIELKNIVKIFNAGGAAEIKALDNVNLSIQKKEFVVIVGANGSGKSTLLNIIAGNTTPDSGGIYIEGERVNKLKEYERSRWIARMFQNPLMGTSPALSVLENFRLASLRTKKKGLVIGTDNRFRNMVQEKVSMLRLNLENKIDQPMGTLSGGQRQALTLVMAVMAEAKILLMDEPAAALDPRTSDVLMERMKEIIDEFSLTALLITHQVKDALRYGNRIIQMAEGKAQRDLAGDEKMKLQLQDIYSWFE